MKDIESILSKLILDSSLLMFDRYIYVVHIWIIKYLIYILIFVNRYIYVVHIWIIKYLIYILIFVYSTMLHIQLHIVGIQCIQRKKILIIIFIRPHEIISNLTTTSNIVTLYQFLRLLKSGSYIRLRKVGRIADRRIRSWIVRSYTFSNFKQKYIDNDFICWVIT